ncbi:Tetratricopeptide repeat-containing protein [Maridesulfovibrio ferrireducens]|uniref:Tetratricopeptide repeat-containing protein n=1 Tax=Maridesulfovibrio ferrireducens TaxID=246191 RepID=A0A1G9JDC1_9BACT|nr:tetratricopeptide repeat protein [Maridesulfovibrio ferrireducens]SDL35235.1 Tetratricopeptide repeat-containing protein [Maridesulfovibrio ferrireducens]
MSGELTNARKKLAGVSSLLKQQKAMPAVQAVYDAVVAMLRGSLMKSEREEFQELLDSTVHILNGDKKLREDYPLIINYTHGEEKVLMEVLRELLKELQEKVSANAQDLLKAMEKRKRDILEQGQAQIEKGDVPEAHITFNQLIREFKDDTELRAEIADKFIKAGLYSEALSYLEDALAHDPNAIFLYNRIGIVLRKMQDFATAEKYYIKALQLNDKDEYLYFNCGRLYYDWKKWDKMAEAAKKAIKINPSFAEAEKMLKFANKKIG